MMMWMWISCVHDQRIDEPRLRCRCRLISPATNTTSPQSNLRRARRSSADKTNSKLLSSHSPSMLTVRSRSCIWPPRSAALSLLSQWKCCVCFVTFLHMNFSSTPTSILNLTVSQESQLITEFYNSFGVGKYCQLFTHESIIEQHAISALHSPPNCPFPFDVHH